MINIALVGETTLFRNLLSNHINKWQGFTVIMQAYNGVDFLNQLKHPIKKMPNVAILDVQMPVMNGVETAEQLYKQYPKINMLALSQFNDDISLNKMISKGVLGFITKNTEIDEIKQAINKVAQGAYYFTEYISENTLNNTSTLKENILTEREILLIKLCATNMPVKQMGEKLNTGIKNVNKIKSKLFEKFNVTNRSSLVASAIRNKIINDYDL